MEDSSYIFYLLTWIPVLALIFRHQWKHRAAGAGLVIAFILHLLVLHWIGPALYLIPGYAYYDPETVGAGLRQSTHAAIAFAVGVTVAAPFLMRMLRFPRIKRESRKSNLQLPGLYIVFGLISYFILLPLFGGLPTVTAVISVGWSLTVVGLVLKCWDALHKEKKNTFYLWLAVTACLPFVTLITHGFLGYGALAMMLVMSFAFVFYHPRWKVVLASVFLVYFGFSVYVTYMRDRGAIREVVWGGEAYQNRAQSIITTLTDFEILDLSNEDHLRSIDIRLNQSALVGASVQYLESGQQDFAYGDTLWQAMLSVIPRAIWPDKPVTGGSGDLVSQYTGISFERGTSVGVGQVLEFYINFGTIGVIAGFVFMGVLVAVIDRAAALRLLEGDWQAFAFWFLPGLSLLQVGGSLVEITATAGASLVLAVVIKRYVLDLSRSKRALQFISRGRTAHPAYPRPRH